MKQKGFTPILIVLLVAVLGIVGYFIYTNYSNSQSKTEPVVTQTNPIPTPAESTTSTEMANWKTYTNTYLGYSLKYPPDWILSDSGGGTIIKASEAIGSGPEPVEYFIWFSLYENPQHKSFKEVVTTIEGLPKDVQDKFEYSADQIAGFPVYRTTSLPSAHGAESVFFTDSKGNYIEVAFNPYSKQNPWPQQDRFYKIFGQILSTFRFLGSESSSE